ncbi:MAG: hypothetical protein ACRDFW_14690 [bacterium]
MAKRGITIGIAFILLLLMYFSASLLFNRTNPGREVDLIPVRHHLPFLPGPQSIMEAYWRGGR